MKKVFVTQLTSEIKALLMSLYSTTNHQGQRVADSDRLIMVENIYIWLQDKGYNTEFTAFEVSDHFKDFYPQDYSAILRGLSNDKFKMLNKETREGRLYFMPTMMCTNLSTKSFLKALNNLI